MDKIEGFRGKYFFLSNFYPVAVKVDGVLYKNNEAAFQSFKHEDDKQREFFSTLDPSAAKRAGQSCRLRKDWERIKEAIMYKVVLEKFTQNKILKWNLLHTGDAILIEENDWGDKTWGTVNGVGKNLLGKILMKVREELFNERQSKS